MNKLLNALTRVARRFWFRLLGLDDRLCPRCGERARRLESHLEFASGEEDDPYEPIVVQWASLRCPYCEARWARKEYDLQVSLKEKRTG